MATWQRQWECPLTPNCGRCRYRCSPPRHPGLVAGSTARPEEGQEARGPPLLHGGPRTKSGVTRLIATTTSHQSRTFTGSAGAGRCECPIGGKRTFRCKAAATRTSRSPAGFHFHLWQVSGWPDPRGNDDQTSAHGTRRDVAIGCGRDHPGPRHPPLLRVPNWPSMLDPSGL